MHEVAAHLATYLRFGQLKILACMLAGAGDFAPGNQKLARLYARRSTADLVELLRRCAGSRTTPPRSGYDPVLADPVLHDLEPDRLKLMTATVLRPAGRRSRDLGPPKLVP